MESTTGFITTKLKLKVNSEKNAVGSPWKRKFLGFRFTAEGPQKERSAPESMVRFKGRVREITRRARGVSLWGRIEALNVCLRGWHVYLGFWQTFFSCSLKALTAGYAGSRGVSCASRGNVAGPV
jgi:RNA-directed DNA polymerase